MSAELLTFHEVVNHMQEDEEEVIDDHRVITEVSSKETDKVHHYLWIVEKTQRQIHDDIYLVG